MGQAKNDYNWILGYPPNKPEINYGGVKFDFNQDFTPPEFFNTICPALYTAVLNSNSGKLLGYSNGCSIFNSVHQYMEEGDTIAYGYIWDNYCEDLGYPGDLNHIFIPWPGDTSKAILIYTRVSQDHETYNYLYSIIEFSSLHPLGIVTAKDVGFLSTGITGFITATKHSNGRDWWIIIPEHNSNRFFINLLMPSGISVIDTQSIGTSWGNYDHSGQAIFSPDGTKYIRFNPWKGLDIFDFDRCSGTLSNPIESGPLTDPIKTAGGVACSMDSKYLYVSNLTNLYQFDLFNANILSSKTLIGQYDGFTNPFPTNFYNMVLAPDGKIYIFSTNSVKDLHIINHPELKGDSCNFIQHTVHLPAYVDSGSPNLPFFRLGSDDGSFCDTLGINNLPIADFRYEIDSIQPDLVTFRNLSYFNPKEYFWTFDDNTSTTLKSPSPHKYAQEGYYHVCLTASNEYGSNTFCRNVLIDYTVSIKQGESNESIQIYPNPFSDFIYFINSYYPSELYIAIYSELGTEIMVRKLTDLNNRIDLSYLSDGVYFYKIMNNGKFFKSGKLIKL